MVQRYSHVSHDIYFMKLRAIVVSLALFCAFFIQARPERDTVAVDPSYFNDDDEPFTGGNTVHDDNSVIDGSAADYTLLEDNPPKTEHKENVYRQDTLPEHSKANTFKQKPKPVTGSIKHISQENKQEIEQETDANNRLITIHGHVIRQRRAAGWSVDDEKNRASKPGKRRRRRKKKKTRQEAMVKYVKENMFKVVVVPTLVLSVLLGGFIWYRCCMEGDVCCLCRACPCACCNPKQAAQAGMQRYVAGVRRDEKGGYYYDELTEEEVKAAEQMGEAAVS